MVNSLSPTQAAPYVGLAWKCRKERYWLFDMDAIRQAAAELGIRHPVLIGVVEAGGRYQVTDGTHCQKEKRVTARGETFEWHHAITIRRNADPATASESIWHELTHAAQAERFPTPKDYDRAYKRENGGRGFTRGYETNPFEIEAREAQARSEEHPLVKTTERGHKLCPEQSALIDLGHEMRVAA